MKYWTTTFIIPNYKWIKRHTEKSNLFENRRARVWIWEVCLSLPDQERYVILLCLHCDLKSHGNSGNKSLTMFLSLLLFSEESGEADYCTSQSFSPSKCNWSLFFFFFQEDQDRIYHIPWPDIWAWYTSRLSCSLFVWKSLFLPSPYINEHCR